MKLVIIFLKERLQQFLINKKIFDEVAVGTRFVLSEVIIFTSS